MQTTMLKKMESKFQEYEFPFPKSLHFIFSRNLLGEDLESPLEPWCDAWIDNLAPIKKLYPKCQVKKDILPFARRQDMDQLACIEKKTAKVIEVHYDLGNPKHMEITDEFDNVWDWLNSVIRDIQLFWER